jgi:hypothetical protein
MVDALAYKLIKDGVEPFSGELPSRKGSRQSMPAVQVKESAER